MIKTGCACAASCPGCNPRFSLTFESGIRDVTLDEYESVRGEVAFWSGKPQGRYFSGQVWRWGGFVTVVGQCEPVYCTNLGITNEGGKDEP